MSVDIESPPAAAPRAAPAAPLPDPAAPLPLSGKLLGIDFGLRRVGLAVTDPAQTMAFPLRIITRTTRQAFFEELLAVIRNEGIAGVVVGYPTPPNGLDSETARQTRNFAASLARRVSLPIALVDETLSTEEALGPRRALGHGGGRAKHVDDLAARVILQTHLSSQRR